MASFPSRYAGRCPACGKRFEQGTQVTKMAGGYGHAECVSTSSNAPDPIEVEKAISTIDIAVALMVSWGAPNVYDAQGFNKPDYTCAVHHKGGTLAAAAKFESPTRFTMDGLDE